MLQQIIGLLVAFIGQSYSYYLSFSKGIFIDLNVLIGLIITIVGLYIMLSH